MSFTNKESKVVLVNDFGQPVQFPISPDGQIREGKNLSKQIVTRGLVGYWKLNEPASSSGANTTGWWRDSAWENGGVLGGMNHGTKTNTTDNAYFAFGNQGCGFSGDDYITISGIEPTEYSLDFWVRLTALGNAQAVVVKGAGQIYAAYYTSQLGLAFGDSVGGEIYAPNTMPQYVWNHFTCVRTTTNRYIYCNGVLVSSGSASAFTPSSSSWCFGANNGSPSLTGNLYGMKIYNVALTVNEVLQNYKVDVPSIPTRGLVSWWKLDEYKKTADGEIWKDRAYELTGVGANPSLAITKNGAMISAEGPTGGQDAAYFTDAGNHPNLYVANNSQLYPGTEFSISLWMKKAASGSAHRIINYGNGTSTGYYIQTGSDGKMRFYVMTSIPDSVASAGNYPISTWTHYVFTWKPDTTGGIKMYINGALDASGNTSGTVGNPSEVFRIGRTNSDTEKIDGSLDEITFYNKELTAIEVRNLFLAYR